MVRQDRQGQCTPVGTDRETRDRNLFGHKSLDDFLELVRLSLTGIADAIADVNDDARTVGIDRQTLQRVVESGDQIG